MSLARLSGDLSARNSRASGTRDAAAQVEAGPAEKLRIVGQWRKRRLGAALDELIDPGAERLGSRWRPE